MDRHPLLKSRVLRSPAGFNLVEAIISMAIFTVAMGAFMQFTSSANQVALSQATEIKAQTVMRRQIEELSESFADILPVRVDSEGLWMVYRRPMLDQNQDIDFSQGIRYGAQPSLDNIKYTVTSFAEYENAVYCVRFVPDPTTELIRESETERDLDGDGALTSTFRLGQLEFGYLPTDPGSSGPPAELENARRIPETILVRTSGPQGATRIFSWEEGFADVNGNWRYDPAVDNFNATSHDRNGNHEWDPIMNISLYYFNSNTDYGAAVGSKAALKFRNYQ